MNSTHPKFSIKPNLSFIYLFTLTIPLFYLILLWLNKNNYIPVFQFTILFAPAFFFIRKFKLVNGFNTKGIIANILLTVSLTLLLTGFFNALLNFLIPWIPNASDMQEQLKGLFSQNEKWGIYIDLFVISLIPAICEETFFRGFLQTSLTSYISPHAAIAITSLTFALYHVNPWLLPFYFLLAYFFGWIYYKTNNLALAMLAHFLNNGFGVALYHLFEIKF